MPRSVRIPLLVFSLTFALVAGGFVHAVVPHDEGDHHSQKEIVWTTLHAALGHEQKAPTLLTLSYLFSLCVVLLATRPFLPALARAVSDKRHRELRRGTPRYRRFD